MTSLGGGAGGTAVASSTSYMNTDNKRVSHKSGHAREEWGRIYKIYK